MARTSSRLNYRFVQFITAIRFHAQPVPIESVQAVLNPSQVMIFQRMQAAEQVHAYFVYQRLLTQGHQNQDLLVAALLHDAGKNRHPPSVVERAGVVLVKKIAPKWFHRWGRGKPHGLRRPFVVAAQHAEWGADMLSGSGASPETVELVRRHHDNVTGNDWPLLQALQAADDSS